MKRLKLYLLTLIMLTGWVIESSAAWSGANFHLVASTDGKGGIPSATNDDFKFTETSAGSSIYELTIDVDNMAANSTIYFRIHRYHNDGYALDDVQPNDYDDVDIITSNNYQAVDYANNGATRCYGNTKCFYIPYNSTNKAYKFTVDHTGSEPKITVTELTTASGTPFKVTTAAPTTNPQTPTAAGSDVFVVFSDTYGHGDEVKETNAGWGGIPTTHRFTAHETYTVADGHKVMHYTGASANGRILNTINHTSIGNANAWKITKAYISIWPIKATKGRIYEDNARGTAGKYADFTLIPQKWNDLELDFDLNNSYVVFDLSDENDNPETEFYFDHFYFTKDDIPAAKTPVYAPEDVLVVLSRTYGRPEAMSGTDWGVSAGTPQTPLYTSATNTTTNPINDAELNPLIKVTGSGYSGYTGDPKNNFETTAMTGYSKAHVAIWPTTATKGRIFQANDYNSVYVDISGLTPGQWNYIDVPINFTSNYLLVYLTQEDGTPETSFYIDHFYVSKIPTIPTPTQEAEDVVSIYGSFYTPATTMTKASWNTSNPQETLVTDTNNKEMRHLDHVDYIGYNYSSAVDITDMDFLHVDIYPLSNMTQASFDIITGQTWSNENPYTDTYVTKDITTGQWNSFDIPLKDLKSSFREDDGRIYTNQFKVTQNGTINFGGTEEFYLTNIYYYQAPPYLNSLHLNNDAAKHDILNSGDYLEIWPLDQFGNQITSLVYSPSTDAVTKTDDNNLATLGSAGNTTTVNVSGTEGGYFTITFTYGDRSISKSYYVVGNKNDAPRVPGDIFQPIYSNGKTEINGTVNFTYGVNGDIKNGNATYDGGLIAKHIYAHTLGSTFSKLIGNQAISGDTDGHIKKNPVTEGYKELYADVFISDPTNAEIEFWFEGYNGTKRFTNLSQGWNTLSMDMTTIDINLTAFGIRAYNINDVLVSNVYFTKVSDDTTAPTFDVAPSATNVTRTTATLNLQATDNVGTNKVRYVVYNNDTNTFVTYIEANSGEAVTYDLTQLTPDASYTYKVELYDENGNKATDATVSFTTIATRLVKIDGTVVKEGSADKDIAEQYFETASAATQSTKPEFTLIDEDGNAMSESTPGLTIKYIVLNDKNSILNTSELSTTTTLGKGEQTFPYQTDAQFTFTSPKKQGTADIRIQAEYKGDVVLGHYAINVYDPELTIVSFTAGGTTYTNDNTGSYHGNHGDLRLLLNNIINPSSDASGEEFLTVTDLTVEGNLNTADLRTLREMGGVYMNMGDQTSYNIADKNALDAGCPYYFENNGNRNKFRGNYGVVTNALAAHGSLHTLDLSEATFSTIKTPIDLTEAEKHYNIMNSFDANARAWSDLTEEEKNANAATYANVLVTLPVTAGANMTGLVDWHNTGALYDINMFAFLGCTNLEKVTLPEHEGLYVGQHAFEYCENLADVVNLANVTQFDANCFYMDESLVGGSDNNNKVRFNQNTQLIAYAAFNGCRRMVLESPKLPDAITNIGDIAFAGCHSLGESVVYPDNAADNIKHMNTGVFQNCKNLKNVYLPQTTVTIGYIEFQDCSDLEHLKFYATGSALDANNLPTDINTSYASNVKNIIANGFQGCSKLADADIAQLVNVNFMGASAFENCDQISNTTVQQLLDQFRFGHDAHKSGGNPDVLDEEYNIPAYLFANCDGFDTAIFRNNIHQIGNNAFNNCSRLKDITFTTTVTTVKDLAFNNCTSMRYVRLQDADGGITFPRVEPVVKNEGQANQYNEYHDAFNNISSNRVTVVFDFENADTYYTNYVTDEANKTQEGVYAITRLLTKQMREAGNSNADGNNTGNNEKYFVAEQQHAIVKMDRTLKANWNTLLLPFALDADQVKAVFGDDAYVAQFGWKNEDDEMIYKRGSNLHFVKVNTVAAGTPYIVQVSNATTQLTANNVNIGHYVTIGDEETALDQIQDKASADAAFTFTGNLDNVANIVSNDYGILYIKDGLFYNKPAGATTTTRMKGFRAWFKTAKEEGENDEQGMARAFTIMVSEALPETEPITDKDDEEEEIIVDSLDGIELDINVVGDIYNLNGQLLKRQGSIKDMQRGVYIVNGKKYIVK